MKKGRILFLLGSLLMSTVSFGQDYAFKVLANKGSNEVRSGDTWMAVKTGTSLKSGDELKMSENSYVGLVHVTGKPMELKQAGSYKVADLAAKVGSGSSVLNKYTDFILSSNSAEAKKNRLSATGAVHRGTEVVVDVFLPENQYADIFNTKAIINWKPTKSGGPYIVTLKNMFDEELAKIETPETVAQIDLSTPDLANESAILVEVKSKADGTKSEQHLIKRMNAAQMDKIKKDLAQLPADVTAVESALNKLFLAGFFEQNKLFIDAITAYEQAIKLAPDVPTFRENYDEFLLRSKLKDPEQ